MSKKKVALIMICFLACSILVLSACSNKSADKPAAPAQKVSFSIGTGSNTGTFYFIGAGMAELVNKYSGSFQATAEATGGTSENIGLVNNGNLQFGFAGAGDFHDARAGINGYVGKQSTNMKILMAGHYNVFQFLTLANSNVKSYSDLKGKKIGYPPSPWVMLNVFKSAFGWEKDKDFTVQYAPHADNAESLKDKKIAAMGWDAGLPTSIATDMSTSHDIKMLPITDEMWAKISAAYPYYVKTIIPAGMYGDVKEDIPTFGVPVLIIANDKVSDDMAYALTKAVLEHTEEFTKIHPSGSYYNLNGALNGVDTSLLHPGAAKYYKEKGKL